MNLAKRLAVWAGSPIAGFLTWSGERLIAAGGWITSRLKGLLPLIAVGLIYTAASILRVSAVTVLVSIPVMPAAVVRAWGPQV